MSSRVAVVTGANKGIGFEIVRGLLKLGEPGLRVVLCARDTTRGDESLQKLKKEFPSRANYLTTEQLEITSPSSIVKFSNLLEQKYTRLDILIHNAAVGNEATDSALSHQLKHISDINYYGTINVNKALLPLLSKTQTTFNTEPRIIILSSQLATSFFQALPKPIQASWTKVSTLEGLEHMFKTTTTDLLTQKLENLNYAPYSLTKVGVTVYAKVLAKDLNDKVFVASMCPGYCDTDMTNHLGPRSAEKGAETAVWLALLKQHEVPSGKFWYDKSDISFL